MREKVDYSEPQDKLWTRAYLADWLTVSIRKVGEMESAKKLPAPVRLGTKIIRYDPEEIRAWIKAGAPSREKWEALKEELELVKA